MATRRNDHSYVKRRDALKARSRKNNAPCHLCQGKYGPIDYDGDYRSPKAFTADHIEAVAAGGRMVGPLMPAHRSCNSKRGKKDLAEYLNGVQEKGIDKPRTTRKWYG